MHDNFLTFSFKLAINLLSSGSFSWLKSVEVMQQPNFHQTLSELRLYLKCKENHPGIEIECRRKNSAGMVVS